MTPRRIVHLTTFLQGGAGRAITDLACAQHHLGHEVLVLTSATGEPGYDNYPAYLDRLNAAGVPFVMQDSLFKRDEVLNDQALERLCALRAPESVDIVHAHAAVPATIGLRFAALVTASAQESPVERTSRAGESREADLSAPRTPLHGAPHPDLSAPRTSLHRAPQPDLSPPRRAPLYGAPQRPSVIQTQHGWGTSKTAAQAQHDLQVLGLVDRVIVTSHATGEFLVAAGVQADRITAIPCGLSPAIPTVAPEAVALLRTLRREGGFILGCVGSVNANKNQQLVIRVLSLHLNRPVSAVFIGEGGESLEVLARELGVADRVHTLGYRDDAERWIELFDALVVPSQSEGQGLVVLEAFRAGVPVLASNIPALRELVNDYETGWTFEPDNPRTLVDAIERAASASDDVRGRIIDTASKLFVDQYTIDVMVARHEALYDELRPRTTPRRPV